MPPHSWVLRFTLVLPAQPHPLFHLGCCSLRSQQEALQVEGLSGALPQRPALPGLGLASPAAAIPGYCCREGKSPSVVTGPCRARLSPPQISPDAKAGLMTRYLLPGRDKAQGTVRAAWHILVRACRAISYRRRYPGTSLHFAFNKSEEVQVFLLRVDLELTPGRELHRDYVGISRAPASIISGGLVIDSRPDIRRDRSTLSPLRAATARMQSQWDRAE